MSIIEIWQIFHLLVHKEEIKVQALQTSSINQQESGGEKYNKIFLHGL